MEDAVKRRWLGRDAQIDRLMRILGPSPPHCRQYRARRVRRMDARLVAKVKAPRRAGIIHGKFSLRLIPDCWRIGTAGSRDAPVPPVFVGGLPSSGKTAVVRDLFQVISSSAAERGG